MRKMEMSEVNVPKLRFREFEGEWVEKRLGDIATFSKGKGISKSDIVENGKLECIRYGELYTVYGELITNIKSTTNLDKSNLILSEYNDVIIPASGETQIDIATASCILKDNVALSGDLNIIKADSNGLFLAYYLNSAKKIDIAKLAQGISVVHLYSSQLKMLKLNLPQKPEQQKIANFLTSIDQKIEQLTKKEKLLVAYKEGVMQKIFSRQIRFRDDNGEVYGDWVDGKLGDYGKLIKGLTYSPDNISDNGLLVLRSSNIQNNQISFKDNVYVDLEVSDEVLTRENDILICVRNGSKRLIGKNIIIQGNLEKSTHGAFMTVFRGDSNKFIAHWFKTQMYYKEVHKNLGATINSINGSDLKKFKTFFPQKAEQTKIANFLSSIDKKIEQVNRQIEESKGFKKGLLQQMFV